MAEFCECGSLVIGGRCTNKSCSLRAASNPASVKKTTRSKSTKSTEVAKSTAKASNPRRASKCITYNLFDKQEKEPDES